MSTVRRILPGKGDRIAHRYPTADSKPDLKFYASLDCLPEDLKDSLTRGYETAVDFTRANRNEYRGLLLLFCPKDDINEIVVRGNYLLNEENPELRERYSESDNYLMERFGRGMLFFDKILDLYAEMSERDGGIVFGPMGNVIGTEVYVEGVVDTKCNGIMDEIRRIKGRNGASSRHAAGVFASRYGVSSVIVSEEKGTVITVCRYRLLGDLFYNPADDQSEYL